jgi:3-isopropylmalate/(R)-2-methylmalate dehydratase large subunit
MTMTEKILAKHSGRSHIAPNDNVWVNVDVLMTHDVCGPGTIGIFHEQFGRNAKVWDKDRVVVIPDHYIFTADQKCHRNVQILRDFVKEQGLKYYYDPEFVKNEPGMPNPYRDPTKTNYKGVCHKALPRKGTSARRDPARHGQPHLHRRRVRAVRIGRRQHRCGVHPRHGQDLAQGPADDEVHLPRQIPPYLTAQGPDPRRHRRDRRGRRDLQADVLRRRRHSSLTLEDRMTLTNMAIEAGGKNGVCDVDEKTLQYVRARSNRPEWEVFTDDKDAKYAYEAEWDLATMEPMVAKPHSPDNKDTARNCRDVKLDRAYIGSCTGGKITDMIFAANILKGNKVKIPTYVVPGSTEVHADMLKLNLRGVEKGPNEKSIADILQDAGALLGPSGCAACLGGPSDTFGRLNEALTCISTTNRNFPGRMGSTKSAVYLASPLTVAASALTGYVTDPREYVNTPIETGMAGVV